VEQKTIQKMIEKKAVNKEVIIYIVFTLLIVFGSCFTYLLLSHKDDLAIIPEPTISSNNEEQIYSETKEEIPLKDTETPEQEQPSFISSLTNFVKKLFFGDEESKDKKTPSPEEGIQIPGITEGIKKGGGLIGAQQYPNCPDASGTWTVDSNYNLNQNATCDVIIVNNSATLTVNGTYTIETNNLTVDSGSSISTDYKGCPYSQSPNSSTNVCYDAGTTAGYGEGQNGAGSDGAGGAGHGGDGGDGATNKVGGSIYSSALRPNLKGSGGGYCGTALCASGGDGGGVIRLIVSDTFVLDGEISADGQIGNLTSSGGAYAGGGGSGGSIWITTDMLTGSGSFSADGGDGVSTGGAPGAVSGGGSGGRIAVYFNTSTFTDMSSSNVSGGSGSSYGGVKFSDDGESGTLIFVDIDDNNAWISDGMEFNKTDYTSDGTFKSTAGDDFIFNNLTILNSARVWSNSNVTASKFNIDGLSTWTCDSSTGTEELGFLINTTYNNIYSESTAVFNTTAIAPGSILSFSSCEDIIIHEHSKQLFNNPLALSADNIFINNSLSIDLSGSSIDSSDNLTIFTVLFDFVNSNISGGAVNVSVTNLTLDTSSSISADAKGCPYSQSPNSSTNLCYDQGSGASFGEGQDGDSFDGAGGGAYGGNAGEGETDYSGGYSYSSTLRPSLKGSGGGYCGSSYCASRGAGGGAIRLSISNTFDLDGVVSTDGDIGNYSNSGAALAGGGGSGGSIWVTTEILSGSGNFSADGGDGASATGWVNKAYGGGGSGGRVAVYYDTSTFTGMDSSNTDGGDGPGDIDTGYAGDGEAGTLIFTDIDDNIAWISDGMEFNNSDYYSDGSFKLTSNSNFNFINVSVLNPSVIRFKGNNIFNNSFINFTASNISIESGKRLDLKYIVDFTDPNANYSASDSGAFYLSLEKNNTGRIAWIENISSFLSLESNTNISHNTVIVNSVNENNLNKSANITIYGLSHSGIDIAVDFEDDGTFQLCPASICTEISYSGGTALFNVTQFTTYRTLNNVTDIPVVTLLSPDNNTATNSPTVTFVYNVSDASDGITQCKLIINDVVEETDSSITENINQSFSVFLVNTTYNWSINCTDDHIITPQTGSSEIRNLSVTAQMLVSETLSPSTTSPSNSINISGHVNFTDGVIVADTSVNIYLNGDLISTDSSQYDEEESISAAGTYTGKITDCTTGYECIVDTSETISSSDSPFDFFSLIIQDGVTITVDNDSSCGYKGGDSDPGVAGRLGGPGGGCFKATANSSIIINGTIKTIGADGVADAGGGAGGKIELYAKNITVKGVLNVTGGAGHGSTARDGVGGGGGGITSAGGDGSATGNAAYPGGGGAGGRIKITAKKTEVSGTIEALGGAGGVESSRSGGGGAGGSVMISSSYQNITGTIISDGGASPHCSYGEGGGSGQKGGDGGGSSGGCDYTGTGGAWVGGVYGGASQTTGAAGNKTNNIVIAGIIESEFTLRTLDGDLNPASSYTGLVDAVAVPSSSLNLVNASITIYKYGIQVLNSTYDPQVDINVTIYNSSDHYYSNLTNVNGWIYSSNDLELTNINYTINMTTAVTGKIRFVSYGHDNESSSSILFDFNNSNPSLKIRKFEFNVNDAGSSPIDGANTTVTRFGIPVCKARTNSSGYALCWLPQLTLKDDKYMGYTSTTDSASISKTFAPASITITGTSSSVTHSETGPSIATNSSGDYTYETTAPSTSGTYPVKVNLTYQGYYAENTKDLTVTSLSYLIQGFNSGLDALLQTNESVNVEVNGQTGTQKIRTKKGANRIFDVDVTFDQNHSWSDVSADLDTTQGKAFFHLPAAHTECASDRTLYIPAVQNTGWIYVCPNATSLGHVNETCPNYYTLTDLTATDGYYNITVTGTGAAEGANTNLTIWDETETDGSPYSGQTRYQNEQVKLFTNYTNKTSGSILIGADCNISFADSVNNNMSYNNSLSLYEYNRSFSLSDIYDWNVTCSITNYDTLTATDSVVISSSVTAIPEFSDYAVLFILITVISGFLLIRKKN